MKTKSKKSTLRQGHQVNQAVSLVADKPKSRVPGTMRGQMSKMPQGPSVGMDAKGPDVKRGGTHASRGKRLKGIVI